MVASVGRIGAVKTGEENREFTIPVCKGGLLRSKNECSCGYAA